jgi:hypothetical protein
MTFIIVYNDCAEIREFAMSLINRKGLKTKLIDYAVPFFLLGLALGASYYIIDLTEFINKLNLQNIHQLFGLQTENRKINLNRSPGLFRNEVGAHYYKTISGNVVKVPAYYYPYVKKAIIEYNAKSASLPADIRQINTYDVWSYSSSDAYYTGLYAAIIQAIADIIEEDFGQTLSQMLADYSNDLKTKELELTELANQLYDLRLKVETNKLHYNQASGEWRNIWIRHFECLSRPDQDKCPVTYYEIMDIYTMLNTAYLNYRNSITEYKELNKELTPQAEAIYNDIKQTGESLDLLINTINAYELMPIQTKNFIASLAQEISLIKNNISVKPVMLTELTAILEVNNPNVNESMESFKSIEVMINENKANKLGCLAVCINSGAGHCKDSCQ